jgi:hypothetical protein
MTYEKRGSSGASDADASFPTIMENTEPQSQANVETIPSVVSGTEKQSEKNLEEPRAHLKQ